MIIFTGDNNLNYDNHVFDRGLCVFHGFNHGQSLTVHKKNLLLVIYSY